MDARKFSKNILAWFDRHGRKHLPWQKPRTPYRVWVSEIMLQQTQVNTVIDYFLRFIKRFPDLETLAAANIDEVLALWTGLGYYARARNLHRTAQIIQHEYQGKFPRTLAALQELPGIGRSTAGAIMALSMNKRAAILDGNVKRVLCRFHAVEGWPGNPQVMQELWNFAEQYTPQQRIQDYTQAMMDLGALVCTRTQPKCGMCPLKSGCVAYKQDDVKNYPQKKPTKKLPVRAINLLMLCNDKGEILLEKRPPVGIWGGLWSFPECAVDKNIKAWCAEKYFCKFKKQQVLTGFRHTFSHFHLDIKPILLQVSAWRPPLMEADIMWCDAARAASKGLAAPVKKLLGQMEGFL